MLQDASRYVWKCETAAQASQTHAEQTRQSAQADKGDPGAGLTAAALSSAGVLRWGLLGPSSWPCCSTGAPAQDSARCNRQFGF
jgi:hypothetical protein